MSELSRNMREGDSSIEKTTKKDGSRRRYTRTGESQSELYEKEVGTGQGYHWVSWSDFIAYGNLLKSRKGDESKESIRAIVAGEPYRDEISSVFPRGIPEQRTDIVLERQNKDPKTQGVLEAVSNAIDAISSREKIGQFGLGVKQILTWLENEKGIVSIVTKNDEENYFALKARKNTEGELQLAFSSATETEKESFSEQETGTKIVVSDIHLTTKQQAHLRERVIERFRYVPETTIRVDDEIITGRESVEVIGRDAQIVPQGNIDLSFSDDTIVISDTGSGMNEKTFFKMFLPGHGKGYEPLSAQEAERIAQNDAEILLVADDCPRIAFSRNREADFSYEIPQDRLNTSDKTICVELGRILKTSEGRDGFEIDEHFVEALPHIVQKTLRDTHLNSQEKIAVVNSLLLGIENLAGVSTHDSGDKMSALVKQAKKRISEVTTPYLRTLVQQDIALFPNYQIYEKIAGNKCFVDPYLLEKAADKRHEVMPRLREQDGVAAKDGWKVFTTSLDVTEAQRRILTEMPNPQGIREARAALEDILPVIIDSDRRIVILDQEVWDALGQTRKHPLTAYLRETIQTMLNEHVQTSYEAVDPRVIQLSEKPKVVKENIQRYPSYDYFDTRRMPEFAFGQRDTDSHLWHTGEVLSKLNPSGVLKQYDLQTNHELASVFIPELQEPIVRVQPCERGTWVLKEFGGLLLLDSSGAILESYDTPNMSVITRWSQGMEDAVTLTKEGKILFPEFHGSPFSKDTRLQVFDPQTQTGESYDVFDIPRLGMFSSLSQTEDGVFFITREDGSIFYTDAQNNRIHLEDWLNHNHLIYNKKVSFFEMEGKHYAVGVSTREYVDLEDGRVAYNSPRAGIFSLDFVDGEIVANHLVSEGAFLNGREINECLVDVHVDSETNTVAIQVGKGYFIYKHTEGQFESIHKRNVMGGPGNNDLTTVLISLKDLFGDEISVPYTQAVPLLHDRLLQTAISDLDESGSSFLIDDIEFRRSEKLISQLASPQFREIMLPLWESLQDNENPEQLEHLKMRFIQNAPLLLDLSEEQLSSEMMQLFFFADNPQFFFEQLPEQQTQLFETLNSLSTTAQKEHISLLAQLLTQGKTEEEQSLFYEQLGKLCAKDTFRRSFFRALASHDSSVDQMQTLRFPEKASITDPLRAYVLFLSNQADLIRSEASVVYPGDETTVTADVPLELFAYLRLTEGLHTMDEVTTRITDAGGAAALIEEVDLSFYRDEIKKAIHAQATEAGVSKRELMQNALSAIRSKGEESGEIAVDFYLREQGKEYVEEIQDTGTGIRDLIAFLVPGVTTKDEREGLGTFGTGFYKTLEDVDTIEVESISERDGEKILQRIRILVDNDSESVTQGGIVQSITEKSVAHSSEQGTKIRLVRNTKASLPELEAMIAKNTYFSMAGLATDESISGMDIRVSFTNEDGRMQSKSVAIEDSSSVPTEIGDILFVQSELPSHVSSAGLRMSPLSERYLQHVPARLKTYFEKEGISVVLPKTLQLIKDRSRIAHEEEFLPEIQRAIATESLRRVSLDILSGESQHLRGVLPEDLFSSRRYYEEFTSHAGYRAHQIAQRINAGEIITDEDCAYITNPNHADALVLTLMGIERTMPDGKKDSLIRRVQAIQRKAGDPYVSRQITNALSIDEEETASETFSPREEARVIAQTEERVVARDKGRELDESLRSEEKPEDILTLQETALPEDEKQLLENYFSYLGLQELYFVPQEKLGARGSCNGSRMYLASELLSTNPEKMSATILHEIAHFFEARAKGIYSYVFDTPSDSAFTHQQGSSFAEYYKLAALVQQQQLLSEADDS